MKIVDKFLNNLRVKGSYNQPIYIEGYDNTLRLSRVLLILIFLATITALFFMLGSSNDNKNLQSSLASDISKEAQGKKSEKYEQGKVVEVIDGDTVEIIINGHNEKLRLIGVDTPETKDPRKPIQCFGKEATAYTQSVLGNKEILLEADPSQGNRDKYGRLLRYVFLLDGTHFNNQIIYDGYAHEYTYNIPYKYQAEFKASLSNARESDRGLWSPDTCNGKTSHTNNSKNESVIEVNALPTSGCDTNYYGGCVPIVDYDLDCSDISFSVKVTGSDIHKFDGDYDGYGCESN